MTILHTYSGDTTLRMHAIVGHRKARTVPQCRCLGAVSARPIIFGSHCTLPHNHDSPKPPVLWAKANITYLTNMGTFTHDCLEDHIDSKSWATRSKVFGDADRKVRLSFTPRTRMAESVLVIHLELFGRVFEQKLREAGISFPSLADLEKDRLRLTPNDSLTPIRPRTLAQIEAPSSRSPSSTSTSSSYTRPSRIPRLVVSPRQPDSHAQGRLQQSHDGLRTPASDLRRPGPKRGEDARPPQASPLAPTGLRLGPVASGETGITTSMGGPSQSRDVVRDSDRRREKPTLEGKASGTIRRS